MKICCQELSKIAQSGPTVWPKKKPTEITSGSSQRAHFDDLARQQLATEEIIFRILNEDKISKCET